MNRNENQKKTLTIADIESRVEKIRTTAKDDPEGAHGLEDDLHLDTLKAIASGARNAKALAAAAIETENIEFKRYYA